MPCYVWIWSWCVIHLHCGSNSWAFQIKSNKGLKLEKKNPSPEAIEDLSQRADFSKVKDLSWRANSSWIWSEQDLLIAQLTIKMFSKYQSKEDLLVAFQATNQVITCNDKALIRLVTRGSQPTTPARDAWFSTSFCLSIPREIDASLFDKMSISFTIAVLSASALFM